MPEPQPLGLPVSTALGKPHEDGPFAHAEYGDYEMIYVNGPYWSVPNDTHWYPMRELARLGCEVVCVLQHETPDSWGHMLVKVQ